MSGHALPLRRTCGIDPFQRKRVTRNYDGIYVVCLNGFDPAGLPVRVTVGAGLP